jgi:hypothetical protein
MMAALGRIVARVHALFGRREIEEHMAREIGAHLTLLQDGLERRGLSPGARA